MLISYCNDSVCITGMRVTRTMKQSDASKNIVKSGLVSSSQTAVHPHLEKYVRRHLEIAWSQPFHQPTIDTYCQLVNERVFSADQPIILDSGCGTGKSTQELARMFPRHIVIGVDRSRVRLAKSGVDSSLFRSENCILVRAELSTFWRLLVNDGHSPEQHYLFYPNPSPKPAHLLRRWHGHPVFPQLLLLGGVIEMRCNWEIYALEFAQAVKFATGAIVKVKKYQPENGISPFEQKYLERGQPLFSVTVPARVTETFRLSRPMC
jgi:tRNA (guanine-N7-)-methyltransferase